MLEASYVAVSEVRSREEFSAEVVAFARGLGFATVAAMAVFDHGVGRSEFVGIDNAPEGYADAQRDEEAARRDPVMQHCRRQTVPIVWDRGTYRRAGLDGLWQQQAMYGYCTGIALALHLPHGRHFAIGVEREAPLPEDSPTLTRMVADLQLFAVHAQEAALRLLAPAAQAQLPQLSARELQALHWTMRGKTAWEVGAILGISERTAVMHVHGAMRKLGCGSKHQAVLQALQLGLLDADAQDPPAPSGRPRR